MRRRLVLALGVVVGLGLVALALARPWAADEPDGAAVFAGSTDDDVVDVVVLAPADGGAEVERAVGMITDAASMWQGGLAALAEDGAGRTLRVSRTDVASDGTAELTDPEIVFVLASAADSGPDLVVHDVAGQRCASYPDVLGLEAWRARDDFASHHELPEGTLVATCEARPQDVCFAVNGVFEPGAGAALSPFEEFTLVGDELGHCLDPSAPPTPLS